MKTINDLLYTVLEEIKVDVHCNDCTAIEELLKCIPIKNLIEYLPEEYQKQFKHLKNENNNS